MLGKCFFSRDPERPFDTERPRNWRRGGILCVELDCGKLWRREFWSRTQWVKVVAKGWFQMLFGRLVSGSIGIQSVRLTPTVRGIGARLEQNSMG